MVASRAPAGLASALVLCALSACRATPPEALNPDLAVPDPVPAFLDPEEAALFIGHADVVFVDARPPRRWRRGHVPGAVSLQWTDLRERGGGLTTGRLDDDADHLAEVVGRRGISPESWVILVGDPLELWGEEARVAWVLMYLGQRRVSLLDGGMAAWRAADLPVQRGRLTLPEVPYAAHVDDSVLARKADVRRFSEDVDEWQTVLVDVRTSEEFRGTRDSPRYGAPRAGRIPGAVHLPWQLLLDGEGKLKPRQELRDILIPRGVRPDARIITYCTGGVRSAHTWYVLHALGYPDVRNYAGSWWEWSVDRRLPVETGPAKPRPYLLPPFPLGSAEPTPEPTPPGPLPPGDRYGKIPTWLRPPSSSPSPSPSSSSSPSPSPSPSPSSSPPSSPSSSSSPSPSPSSSSSPSPSSSPSDDGPEVDT